MKKFFSRISAVLLAVLCMASSASADFTAEAAQVLTGYKGDVNHDITVNAADLVILSKYLLKSETLGSEYFVNADLNDDGTVDSFDLVALRQCVCGLRELTGIYTEIDDPVVPEKKEFITPSISEVYSSMPSQNNANLVIFYVDFPDCRYNYVPSNEEIEEIAFGPENPSAASYPFESMSAFYSRSSKGAINLQGKVFRYTTKENQYAYNKDKEKLAMECYNAFRDSEDFSRFDGNSDGVIDATLLTVPLAAGETNWWPSTGGFFNRNYTIDGLKIGHMITGNAQIVSPTDFRNFNTSYLHEMGHCMGLPDYYLYYSNDSEGFHGTAGTELMDYDASSDFGAFSKLMLGWYREDQVSVYDRSLGSQTFTLNNAQTELGNCVIIPYGKLDERYFSEYFIIEYSTAQANNSSLPWWQKSGSGVRIHHVKADLDTSQWWTFFKYESGSVHTNDDNSGLRLIRILNDTNTDNFFRTGNIIDNSVPGFGWYDAWQNESVDPGVRITIGELKDDKYTITISNK